MELRLITPEDYELVREFLAGVGTTWAQRVGSPEQFSLMMSKTDRAVVAWDGPRVVGFARALCDGVSNGYLSTVAVADDQRGQGIGRKLIEKLIGNDRNITWILRASPGSERFWEKMGFKMSDSAMERVRS
jgi:GNAT superfamily N-acetyltransferase